MENSWGGYSQVGYGILLTPRGYLGRGRKTLRFDKISFATLDRACNSPLRKPTRDDSLAAQRWSIHDDLMEDLDANAYSGGWHGLPDFERVPE